MSELEETKPRRWDRVIHTFLEQAGLFRAASGLNDDLLILNEAFEKEHIPAALANLHSRLAELDLAAPDSFLGSSAPDKKVEHVRTDGGEPFSRSSVTKSIAGFLARNRRRIDASNRVEFLSQVPKRRRLNPEGDEMNDTSVEVSTCARTDAIKINRDVQMKYDVARNDDGPLRRTTGASLEQSDQVTGDRHGQPADIHSGLHGRMKAIEAHLSVRYVPSPPPSLNNRLKLLEDHIIRLEKDYPPWAALHFNQPRRGWPPPPRATPIIVSANLMAPDPADLVAREPEEPPSDFLQDSSGSKSKAGRKNKSSLHRAVMEKLQVKRALSDLTRDSDTTG